MPIVEVAPGFEDRHVLADRFADPDERESLAFLLPLPEQGLGVIFYTWVHAVPPEGEDGLAGRAGAMLVVYGPALDEPVSTVSDGHAVPDGVGFDDWSVGPARMTVEADMGSGSLRFDGEDTALDVTWRGLNPSFAFGANRNGCPSWLAADRTEQGVHYDGTLRVGGREIVVDQDGHRDHSWGRRDWGGATHWKWWNVLGRDGTAIHVMELQAFGTTTLHGYVHRDGVTGTVVGLDHTIEFDERFMQVDIRAEITDDEGRTTRVRTTKGADLHWPVSAYLTLHEAAMDATIDDDVPGVAYMELAWPPAYADHHRGAAAGDGAAGLTIDPAD